MRAFASCAVHEMAPPSTCTSADSLSNMTRKSADPRTVVAVVAPPARFVAHCRVLSLQTRLGRLTGSPRSGVLRGRSAPLERVGAYVCREAGAARPTPSKKNGSHCRSSNATPRFLCSSPEQARRAPRAPPSRHPWKA